MKIVACNWKDWTDTWQDQDQYCQWLFAPHHKPAPPGTHYKLLFVFSDWLSVAFGPKETVDHIEWVRVIYSLLAIVVGLVALLLPKRKMGLQVYLTTAALAFPVYTLLALRYGEGFPAPSLTFLYLTVSVMFFLSTFTGFVFGRFEEVGKTLYVFLGAPLFVLFLSGIEGSWPSVGMDIGQPPTYNLPYFVGLVVAVVCSVLIHIKKIPALARDFLFHFSSANYFVLALIGGLYPSIDFFTDAKDPRRIEALGFGVGGAIAVLATFLKLWLNRNAEGSEDNDQDSEIEMADPEVGEKSNNPLLQRNGSNTLTSNPLWALSKDPEADIEEMEKNGEKKE